MGRWMISRGGLAALFGRPVLVINDVAAEAWSILADGGAGCRMISGGAPRPDFSRTGRWAVAMIGRGVGLAAIDIDRHGDVRILECEAGHTGFSPEDETEDRLHAHFRRRTGHVSWERLLMLDPGDPAWTEAGLNLTPEQRREARIAMMGGFIGDTVLSLGAWSGVFVTGPQSSELSSPRHIERFTQRYEGKQHFRRLMSLAPRWQPRQGDVILAGVLAALGRRYAPGALRAAA